jgi:hypothetical protein
MPEYANIYTDWHISQHPGPSIDQAFYIERMTDTFESKGLASQRNLHS